MKPVLVNFEIWDRLDRRKISSQFRRVIELRYETETSKESRELSDALATAASPESSFQARTYTDTRPLTVEEADAWFMRTGNPIQEGQEKYIHIAHMEFDISDSPAELEVWRRALAGTDMAKRRPVYHFVAVSLGYQKMLVYMGKDNLMTRYELVEEQLF